MLTKRQAECHRFIVDFLEVHERGPSLEEIAQGLGGKNASNAGYLVNSLIRKGALERDAKHQLCFPGAKSKPPAGLEFSQARAVYRGFRPIRWAYSKTFGWEPNVVPLPIDGKVWYKAVHPEGEDQKLVMVEKT